MTLALIVISAAMLFVPRAAAIQSVPYQMNFQGRLNNSAGAPMAAGIYNMTFRIFSSSTGGTALWTETKTISAGQGVTITTGGLFSTQLGSVTSLPPAIFNSASPLYLEVELPTPATATTATPSWAEGPMSPRNPIASSPYSLNSDLLDGLDSSAFAMATGGTGYIQNQTASAQTASFRINGTGSIQGSSATAFQVQNAAGVSIFSVDTANSRVVIGTGSAGNTTGYLLVLDSKTNAGDPTGVAGGMYYSSSSNTFRCYENGAWRNCTQTLDTTRYVYANDFLVNAATDLCSTQPLADWVCTNDGSNSTRANKVTDDVNHPGMFAFSSGSTTTGYVGLLQDTGHTLNPAYIRNVVFYVKTDANLANYQGFRVGLMDQDYALTDYAGLTGGWYFEYDGAANWKITTRKSSTPTETKTTTSSAIAASTWYRLELRRNASGGFDFYINGTNVGSSNLTNASADQQQMAFMVQNGTSVRGKLIIDYAGFEENIPSRQ